VKNIQTMCAPGYPASGAGAAFMVMSVHQVKTVAFQRTRSVATGVKVPTGVNAQAPIADLPSDTSASTSERRT